ncbi:amidohydrolase [Marinitenerispora sediminis]|uniref:amidohydrolase n=1 Tax=Marinitenerispora sediminis TaxID=1931232 RepID=UPI000DF3AFF9|nr:amidohydrolase [Marinitenerispora sediminis]
MEAVPQAVDPQRVAQRGSAVMGLVDEIFPLVEGFYVDLHRNPELSHQEHRTARAVAEWLSRAGFEVATGIGGTGVVGVLRNGDGPTVLLRGDMDALPVEERTGLPYASTARGVDGDGNEVPIMHACGHDLHTACLVGTADLLAGAREQWSGTLMIVAQPAEETVDGAAGMLRDGVYERFGRPDVALAQHVGPQPAGMIGHRAGVILGAGTTLQVRIHGTGGHASRPHTAVDPVVIAANIVNRLQTIVSREVDPGEMAVVTVGVLRAGTKANIIPDEAYLEVNTRALNERVGRQLQTAVERIVRAEAAASGAPREPEITLAQQAGVTDNDPAETAALAAAHRAYFGDAYVVDFPEPFSGSEDFGEFGLPGDDDPVPYVFWFLGGTPHDVWAAAPGETPYEKLGTLPSNHSPFFAPDREPTLRAGLAALTIGALTYLARPEDTASGVPQLPSAFGMDGAGPAEPPAAEPYPQPPAEPAGVSGEDGAGSTRQADMAALLADDEPAPAAPERAGRHAGGDLLDPPPAPRGPVHGTETGPSQPFGRTDPPSGPAFSAPAPQGAPISAPPPPPGAVPYRPESDRDLGADEPPQGAPISAPPPPPGAVPAEGGPGRASPSDGRGGCREGSQGWAAVPAHRADAPRHTRTRSGQASQ